MDKAIKICKENVKELNLNNIKISFVDEVVKKEVSSGNIFHLTEEQKNLAIPAAIIIGLYAILPWWLITLGYNLVKNKTKNISLNKIVKNNCYFVFFVI